MLLRQPVQSYLLLVDGQGTTNLGQSANSAKAAPAETLSGLVERMTYHNPENGFCVLRVKARGQRDLVAVVGHAATINAGEFISTTSWWTTDREHGVQFTRRPASPRRSRPPWRGARSTWAPA